MIPPPETTMDLGGGGGAALLAEHGLSVRQGVLQAACRRLILPFAKTQRSGLPWVKLQNCAKHHAKRHTHNAAFKNLPAKNINAVSKILSTDDDT